MDKNLLKYFYISLISLYSAIVSALPEQSLVPGGIALLDLPDLKSDTEVLFDGKPVAIYTHNNHRIALAGISLNAKPGIYQFSTGTVNGEITQIPIQVMEKKYAAQRLTIKNKRKVNPNKKDMERISREYTRKQKAKSKRTNIDPEINFLWPVSGEISSIFGLRRFFNDQERKPHNGLDISANEGTPIKATANGTVLDAGNFFFSGNIIFLDHGQGIISLYAHLSRIDVQPGDKVNQGEVIGAVGQTGRVTGPHLHFAVIANQILIDPILMLPADQPQIKQSIEPIAVENTP